MSDEPQADERALVELLDWLGELDAADSYAGFTYAGWLRKRPVAVIRKLRARCGKIEHD